MKRIVSSTNRPVEWARKYGSFRWSQLGPEEFTVRWSSMPYADGVGASFDQPPHRCHLPKCAVA